MGDTSASGVVAGGRDHPTYYGLTEQWDGATWTEVANMSGARYNGSATGSVGSGVLAGGSNPGVGGSVTTEEWLLPQNIKVITD